MKLNLPSLFKKRPPLQEVAPVMGLTGALGRASLFPTAIDPPPGGDPAYLRMQHDPQVKACLNTKKYAILSRGWAVHPASEAASDVAVADFVTWCLQQMAGNPLDALYDVLDALAVGVSLTEINWCLLKDGQYAGMVGLASLKSKDPKTFILETDEFYNLTALRIHAGTELDPAKFLVYSYQPRYGNPWGVSDLRSGYASWAKKEALLTWWAKYLEKLGIPTVMATFDPKAGYTKAQQADLLSVVSQIHNESAVVVPADMMVSLLEAGKGSSTAPFDECISYLDRAIAKSILGQTLTSDSSTHGSTYALGAVHMDVLRFYINKLARDMNETVMSEQLIKRLVAYNFPPGTACPRFALGEIDDDRLAVVGQLISELVTGGVIAPDEPWIRGYLGVPARGAE